MEIVVSYTAYINRIFNLENIKRCILIAFIPAMLFYGISVVGLYASGFHLMEILRDPAQQSGASSLLGFVSNIGIWLWISSSAICFFSVLTGDFGQKQRELLLLVGLFSLLLGIDDFFMIHDRYIHEYIMYCVYAILASALLVRHFHKIIEIDGFPFLLGGALLALSILTDLTQHFYPIRYSIVQVFEEGFKFMGAATWLYFTFRVASFRPIQST